jgi:DNA-binding CsgD family transcriptional regulator
VGRRRQKQQGNRAQLFIAEGTVKTHVKNVLEKLSVVGRTGAIPEAVRRGLVRLN